MEKLLSFRAKHICRGEFLNNILTSQDVQVLAYQTISTKQQITGPAIGKAFYVDTNYQLLGGIIETITDKSFIIMIKLIQKVAKK